MSIEKVIGWVYVKNFGPVPCETHQDKTKAFAFGEIFVKGVERGAIDTNKGMPQFTNKANAQEHEALTILGSNLTINHQMLGETSLVREIIKNKNLAGNKKVVYFSKELLFGKKG